MPTTWDTSTERRTEDPLARVEETFVLTVRDGPDQGSTCAVGGADGARVLVGKSAACDLRLQSPDVSRRHVAFDVTGRGLRVTDLGSTNGTTVNGVCIVEAYVAARDRVRLGSVTIEVEAGGQQPISLSPVDRFGQMLGASEVMRRLYPRCQRLAESGLPTLIEGETGTGKEVLAEALHEASARSGAAFVVFDCTSVPPALAESVLFGHERGSFTGAVAARSGVFEDAHGGTLFIDELGELDLALQPKLLRVLERGEVRRVGANRWIKVNVRVIAATRRDLDREVQAGRFRDDLFFRLAVGRIELPPLRDRHGDVTMLARHFWHALGGEGELPTDVLERLEDYSWPGNVRELYHTVARIRAFGDDAMATVPDALAPTGGPTVQGDFLDQVLDAHLPMPRARDVVLSAFERRYVERVLAEHGGNVARAATAAGIARRYFQIIHARHRK
jgi:two-component system, NtrC family, response regulator HydG